MTVLQQKIEALTKSQQRQVLKFVDQLIESKEESKRGGHIAPLTRTQKAMIQDGLEDLKNGRVTSQTQADAEDLKWLNEL